MYDPELEYICISYRWGELNEQQLETPDYTAHITSFDLMDLKILCNRILLEPDLRDIRYLWIDAISVDQQNKEEKKETILTMSQIYQNATYILAIPDLHKGYLEKNTANYEIIKLIDKYVYTIYKEIFNDEQLDNDSINYDTNSEQLNNNNNKYYFIQKSTNESLLKKMEGIEIENKKLKMEIKELKTESKNKKIKEDKIRIYQFLAYLIEDWSNRAWVISEYHIAKEKYINNNGTPLKYWFISLDIDYQLFFSYHFNDDNNQQSTVNNNELKYQEVNDPISFNRFVKSRFMQRSHLEMILNSNATRNKDRFNAILPSWNKYNDIIINKDTISNWNITDMTSVRLKLYEIMDLWDKATLLHACKKEKILPTFASNCTMYLKIIEKLDYNNDEYKQFEELLLEIINKKDEKEATKIKQLVEEYKMDSKSIWNENLTSIQFDKHHCYLSVKSKKHFIMDVIFFEKDDCRNKLSLVDDDEIHKVLIPFFTSNLPGFNDYPDIYIYAPHTLLIGNKKKNKWLLHNNYMLSFNPQHLCTDGYTFNIY